MRPLRIPGSRSMLPVRITALVLQPKLEEQRYVLQALQPHRPPAIADKYWVGREAHWAEKERGPFIVFLAALADRDNEIKGRQLGADDYVTKPIDFDVLATIIIAR